MAKVISVAYKAPVECTSCGGKDFAIGEKKRETIELICTKCKHIEVYLRSKIKI